MVMFIRNSIGSIVSDALYAIMNKKMGPAEFSRVAMDNDLMNDVEFEVINRSGKEYTRASMDYDGKSVYTIVTGNRVGIKNA